MHHLYNRNLRSQKIDIEHHKRNISDAEVFLEQSCLSKNPAAFLHISSTMNNRFEDLCNTKYDQSPKVIGDIALLRKFFCLSLATVLRFSNKAIFLFSSRRMQRLKYDVISNSALIVCFRMSDVPVCTACWIDDHKNPEEHSQQDIKEKFNEEMNMLKDKATETHKLKVELDVESSKDVLFLCCQRHCGI
jgi:hypothetical protein